MIYSPVINKKIGSTEYWEIQECPDLFLSYVCITTPLTSEKCWIFFGLGEVRIRYRAERSSQGPNVPLPSSRRAEGWQNSPYSISCLCHYFPCRGKDKTLHQAEKPDLQWQNRLEFRFPQIPDSSFTQMRSDRHSHQDTSSHSPDKQGSRHTSWSCVSPSTWVLYLPGWSFL